MSIGYLMDGTLAPFGRIHKRLTTDTDPAFDTGTLPAWLTGETTGTDAGAAYNAPTLAAGGIRIVPAATTGSTATLTGPDVDLSTVTAVQMHVAFTPITAMTNTRLRIGFLSPTAGGFVLHERSVSEDVSLVGRNGATDTVEAGRFELLEAQRYLVTVTLLPGDGVLAVGEGDRVWSQQTFGADMALGTVAPTFQLETRTDATVRVEVHQVVLDRWWF